MCLNAIRVSMVFVVSPAMHVDHSDENYVFFSLHAAANYTSYEFNKSQQIAQYQVELLVLLHTSCVLSDTNYSGDRKKCLLVINNFI